MAPTVGREGGIWILWDSDAIQVQILEVNQQVIHAIIGPRNNGGWSHVILVGEKSSGKTLQC